MIKIAIIGFGRMGREILKQCVDAKLSVVAVVDSPDSSPVGKDAGTLAGMEPLNVALSGSDKLAATLEKTKPDVAMDFTSPSACLANAKVVAAKGVDLVIGTTGFSEKELDELRGEIKKNKVGAVISPNMSIGVNVFWKVVENACRMVPGWDVEIIEKHHRFKKDAPSGTAMKTAQIIARSLNRDLEKDAVYGRKGLKERNPEDIGILAIRAGDIVGEHEVLFGSLSERIEISHIAQSRSAFASGVVAAARYVKGRKGVYGMDDVLGLK